MGKMVAIHVAHNNNHAKISDNQPVTKPLQFKYSYFCNTIPDGKSEIVRNNKYVVLDKNSHYVESHLVQDNFK